ncbi:excisionase family DNA-binding protein [bacterium]|nr:excisionase family DNA-binding protein [bacterium]
MKSYYTTSEVAKLLSVSADTVLKWVKAGKIASHRTPGGHNRIPGEAVSALLPADGQAHAATTEAPSPDPGYTYCWSYYGGTDGVRTECRNCVAYKSQARRCYEMRDIPEEFGHLRLFCQSRCEDCEFFQLTHKQNQSVLVVSRNRSWMSDLARQALTSDLSLETASSTYECGAVIGKFRPDFIVVDCSFGTGRTKDICRHLNDDDRIPFTRIILTSRKANWAEDCAQDVFGWIEKPFTMDQLGALIEGTADRDLQGDTVA